MVQRLLFVTSKFEICFFNVPFCLPILRFRFFSFADAKKVPAAVLQKTQSSFAVGLYFFEKRAIRRKESNKFCEFFAEFFFDSLCRFFPHFAVKTCARRVVF